MLKPYKIIKAVWSNSFKVEEKLNEGNVPALPDCLTERPEEIAELRAILRRASSSDKAGRWVMVHGMGGMGKTVLANQAVRDEQLVEGIILFETMDFIGVSI